MSDTLGVPKKPDEFKSTVKLESALYARLQAERVKEHTTLQELFVRALAEYLNRRGA